MMGDCVPTPPDAFLSRACFFLFKQKNCTEHFFVANSVEISRKTNVIKISFIFINFNLFLIFLNIRKENNLWVTMVKLK